MNRFTHTLLAGSVALLGVIPAMAQQNIAVNDNGAAANANAMLDVSFSNPAVPKGFLIPRMPQFPTPVGVAQDGLTIYATAPLSWAPYGLQPANTFWYFDGANWHPMRQPGQAWTIVGNSHTVPGTAAGQNYLGTTDQMSLAFRTSAVERLRVREDAGVTNYDGNVGIATANPAERLEVNGAIYMTGNAAATAAGTIRYFGLQGYHEGNVNGLGSGWKKLQNDYTEVFGVTYNQQGAVSCTATSAIVPPFTTNLPAPTPNTAAGNWDVNPFPNTTTNNRIRHQWLIRRNELNVELAQLSAPPTNASTQGVCPNVSNINSIDFYVTTAGAANRAYTGLRLRIYHTPATTITGNFDANSGPDQRYVCLGAGAFAVTTTGWKSFGPLLDPATGLAAPFIWNGMDNVVVELCYALGGVAAGDPLIWCTPLTGYACNYSRGVTVPPGAGVCVSVGGAPCATVAGCGMDNTCGALGANVQVRPVMRFNGTSLSTAGPFVSGVTTGKYITFNGGMMVEATTGWAATPAVGGACNRPFHGNGRITAENGVYDGQMQLNDHVFDRWFDGRVNPEDAATFGARATYDIEGMAHYVERERHLPTMKGREEWNKTNGFSLGDLTNQLWETTETQALYTVQLHDRLTALDALATDGPLTRAQADQVIALVATMEGLTELEKAGIARQCEARVVNTITPQH